MYLLGCSWEGRDSLGMYVCTQSLTLQPSYNTELHVSRVWNVYKCSIAETIVNAL